MARVISCREAIVLLLRKSPHGLLLSDIAQRVPYRRQTVMNTITQSLHHGIIVARGPSSNRRYFLPGDADKAPAMLPRPMPLSPGNAEGLMHPPSAVEARMRDVHDAKRRKALLHA